MLPEDGVSAYGVYSPAGVGDEECGSVCSSLP